MRKIVISACVAVIALAACNNNKNQTQEQTNSTTLKDALGKYGILAGVAVNVDEVAGTTPKAQDVITANFSSIVAENCMKHESIEPEEGKFVFDDADSLVAFGEKNGMKVIGHCLVWHNQCAPWLFDKPKEGGELTRDILIERMKNHITTMVKRYKGRIHGWDVVNEAIEDDGSFRQTPFYQIIGPDFIEIALKTAHEADPDAELYLNDFSMSKPEKRAKYVELVNELKAKGCRIDAIGMQSHNGDDYPDLDEYEKSIDEFAKCGVKVMMTELDLNILPKPEKFGEGANVVEDYSYREEMDPYKNGLDEKGEQLFEQRYLDFFKIYLKHKDQISRITLWGVSDKTSWLNDWPIKGRTAYALLFDRDYNPKPVLQKIVDLFK